MARSSELEHNLQVLTSTKLLNLEVSLAAIVHGGALADLDPWDVFCGNGWIVRRRGPVGPRLEIEGVREAVREELRSAGLLKGG